MIVHGRDVNEAVNGTAFRQLISRHRAGILAGSRRHASAPPRAGRDRTAPDR